jgi:hypothetical protein
LGLAEEAALFLRRVDQLRAGTVRLSPAAANQLIQLATQAQSPALIRVIQEMARRYVGAPPAGSPKKAPVGTIGELFDRLLAEAGKELDAAALQELAKTLVTLCKNGYAGAALDQAMNHPDARIRKWCERFVTAILSPGK